ncbi:dipeptidase D [Hathewaya proteolytica DSM 3090]|uniref:Cytosol non-specific dipeptidase n=1 Tax=Hathewaya proteolytica DSM 3090 TaxID=1121331 RepID=A0A1M6KLE0_9CLOT|nr:aminoacyl-histidine dipeptidase [Hathewaya proteolytica]SHJ59758.1 dipeptidase D [Hathewaya proteolytica DSM 3090]
MLEQLKELKSYEVFKFFKEMNQIPRGSKNEKAISDWLVDFAKQRNLEVIQDEALNVIIRKPGTKGYENSPIVVIQGHMDMVCEKEDSSNHDFEKDPIAFIVDGDMLRADKTTLGADDGIAVAMGLAILDSKDISHPPIELLVTTEEEVGMGGAENLDPSKIKGRKLINIDSEEEGVLLVSCSGGVRTILDIPVEREQNEERCYNITIDGLQGGHSGMEIHKQRGNANKLMGRVLSDLNSNCDIKIVDINGGAKMNAIPRSCSAAFSTNAKEEIIEKFAVKWQQTLSNEFSSQDKDVKVTFKSVKNEGKSFTKKSTENIISALLLIPNGVQTMSMEIKGLVESSSNLGIVLTKDSMVEFESAVRSSVSTLKEEIVVRSEQLAKLCGGELKKEADYPAWEYKKDSELRDTCVGVFKEMFGKEPEISAIHAGLECGLFGGKFGDDMDMISMGPDTFDVHTPKEHISIPSIDRMYQYLIEILKKLK